MNHKAFRELQCYNLPFGGPGQHWFGYTAVLSYQVVFPQPIDKLSKRNRMNEQVQQQQIVHRMIGAAKLQVETFTEVEHDTSATMQAMAVVVLVALATGIGSLGSGGIVGFVVGVALGIGGWALWAFVTFLIGTTIFKTEETNADWGQLARTTGFAQSPGLLRVFGFIPVVGGLVFLIAGLWQLAAMVIAIREALDYTSTWRAVGVAVVGFIVYAIVFGIIFAIL